MSLEELEKRVRALEDAEAIRNLKARYAAYCDDNFDADGIAELFTEDGVWEVEGRGRHEGREAIRNFFQGVPKEIAFAIHYSLNPHIEVNGDTARGMWYLFMPLTLAEGNRAMWRAGRYDEEYVRVNGEWKFKRLHCHIFFASPFDEGWGKTPLAWP